jgi:hypothetical protein
MLGVGPRSQLLPHLLHLLIERLCRCVNACYLLSHHACRATCAAASAAGGFPFTLEFIGIVLQLAGLRAGGRLLGSQSFVLLLQLFKLRQVPIRRVLQDDPAASACSSR